MEKQLKKRMYFLTMRTISDIQKGIQSGHAALEYIMQNKDDKELWNFIQNDKTLIILNGGTSNSQGYTMYNNDEPYFGSMETYHQTLIQNNVICSVFYEPDLNNSMTSICFIADERTYDFEKYPDWDCQKTIPYNGTSTPTIWVSEEQKRSYYDWVRNIGGSKNEFLRYFIKQFKLA